MVLEEDRIPAVLRRRLLARRKRLLERRELPGLGAAPDLLALGELQPHVAELEEHGEYAFLADPVDELLRAHAVRLGDGEDVVSREDLAAHLVQVVEDARRVGRHRVDAHEAVRAVRLAVDEVRLLDVDDRVDAESAHALFQPEVRRAVERLAHLGVRPVEIRLLLGEGVEVILLALLAPRPRGAAENRAPVRRRRAVRLRVAPDVPVGLRVRAALPRLPEPGVLIRGMVEHEIHDDADVAALRLTDQVLHVGHRAVGGINRLVVGDVVAVVHHRRRIHRREPDGPDAERPQVVEPRRDAPEVARAAPRRVEEAFRIDLIDLMCLPPFELAFHRYIPSTYKDARGCRVVCTALPAIVTFCIL